MLDSTMPYLVNAATRCAWPAMVWCEEGTCHVSVCGGVWTVC